MKRLRSQDGIALISATIVLMIVLGLAIALLSFADNQQHASKREQAHEVAYSLAEAALNAQISKLGAQWSTSSEWSSSSAPSNCSPTGGAYPTGCQCNNSSTFTGCPSATGFWQNSYTTTGSSWCPPGTRPDAWGSSANPTWSNVKNGWTTYVRDDGGGTTQLFSSSAGETQAPYDLNNDGDLWVRAVGTYHCQTAIAISKVAEQLIPLIFPKDALVANAFQTLNQGNKTILDTAGIYAKPSDTNLEQGQIATRCSGLGSSVCSSFRSGQISPDTCGRSANYPYTGAYGCADYAAPSAQTINSTGLSALKSEAMQYGTYYSTTSSNGCPSTAAQLTSVAIPGGVAPVYVDTSCPSISLTGGTINSASQPGFLILTDQTFTLNGGATFYGLIYDANLCSSGGTWSPCTTPSVMVTVHGGATVQGAINVDGAGEVTFGDTGNGNNTTANFIYDDRIFSELTEFGGADAAPNSFRQLPNSQ